MSDARRRTFVAAVVSVLVGGVLAVLPTQVASAATDTVTTCSGSGPGSLPAVIGSAASGDTIDFSVTCPPASPIVLSSTIDIGVNLTIDGSGPSTLAVSGKNAVEVFNNPAGVGTVMSGLTIEDGSTDTYGGGIGNSGMLTLSNSAISGNNSLGDGGGILNDGTLTITGSTVSNNGVDSEAAYGGGGGGILNNGTLTISGDTLSDNTAVGGITGSSASGGGAILNDGTLTVDSSAFSGNTTTSFGGGINNESYPNDSTLIVVNTTLSDNGAFVGGGISNPANLELTDSTLSDNTASGNVVGSSSPTGATGGGIANFGMLTVADSTLSGNSVSGTGSGADDLAGGGGIFNLFGTVDISNSTVSGSSELGILNEAHSTLTIAASIVANNTSGGDCSGVITDAGYNLDDDGSCGFLATNHSQSGVNADLGPLQENGGPTETMALLSGSPAIGAVNSASLCSTPDQRGVTRPTPCDVGAYQTAASKAGQAITFASTPPSAATVDGPTYTASATASSGLPVTLSINSAATSVCSITGSTVSFLGTGTCSIDANQAGNATYSAAPEVRQKFSVGPASVPSPTITKMKPAKGRPGKKVTISGTNLSGATAVHFNGTIATIKTDTTSKIMTTVPTGATTGPVSVTTPGGTVTSPKNFKVT